MSDEATARTLAGLARGDRAAIAGALNLVEDRRSRARAEAQALLAALPAERLTRSSHLIGLTGPPGVGKSSLAAALIRSWRAAGRTVGVLAVDPSSPLSGGALLGDRLRMLQPSPDDGVFIRSLAGRGELGGLSADVFPMARVMLCAFDVVLIETVGVGQTEVDVVMLTDTTCLVTQPATGDQIQWIKAGILELPALIAINKADMGAAAQQTESELRASLPRGAPDCWQVPLQLVSARDGQGVDALAATLDHHRRWLDDNDRLGAGRLTQAATWGAKRLRLEFGSFGVDALGGEQALCEAWTASDRSPFEVLETLRRQHLSRWRQLDGDGRGSSEERR